MSDISASERRLSAALDRLDQLLDISRSVAPQGDDSQTVEMLTQQLETAQARIQKLQQDTPAPQRVQDDGLRQQLDIATSRNAELAAANDELAAANRNLIEAQDTGGIGADEIRDALEAEVKGLRAARQAEMAQMGEIMAELERLLSDDTATETAPSTEGI
jgi:ABC-type uncharacterized transport system involved in gliding motility auxiliary subunit